MFVGLVQSAVMEKTMTRLSVWVWLVLDGNRSTNSQNAKWLQLSCHLTDKVDFCRIHRNQTRPQLIRWKEIHVFQFFVSTWTFRYTATFRYNFSCFSSGRNIWAFISIWHAEEAGPCEAVSCQMWNLWAFRTRNLRGFCRTSHRMTSVSLDAAYRAWSCVAPKIVAYCSIL